jgi:two-component system CheB/CheR fusion protein
MEPNETNRGFEILLDYLRDNRGFDFTGYKRSSLARRVHKRMSMVGIENFGDYMDHMEVHPEEFSFLFNTILINVTTFFRDKPAWDYLAKEIIPQIIGEHGRKDPIRVWSAGCASGEEAYTLAIVLAEALGMDAFRQQVKIYATDVDEETLTQARHATYRTEQLEPVPAELRDKYFQPNGKHTVFRSDLRRSLIFGRHDLLHDAPISRLDLLVCRNTLMYFNAETQRHILARLHFALKDSGFFFLGKAEMLLTHAKLFTPVNLNHRIFSKVPRVHMRDRLPLLAQADEEEVARLAWQERLDGLAIDAAPAAQVVVDTEGNLVLANAAARLTFGLHSRDLGRPFHDLDLSYRPVELRSPIEQAIAHRTPVSIPDVARARADGEVQHLEVRVVPLIDSGDTLLGVTTVFHDITRHKKLETELNRTGADLEKTNEELQSTNEELETTNEELQSTNEELETTNEELQSTNEEMETMNEELQSTNEEMETLNTQLRQRTAELDQSNAFLHSILATLHSGVVVVDNNYSILVWNQRSEDLWGLRADEVLGQSLLNLDIGLPVEQLKAPIRGFLEGQADHEELALAATTRRGRTIQCYVTCTPFICRNREREGVVLLMEEKEP